LEVQGEDVLIRITRALVKDPTEVNAKQLTATPLLFVCRVIHGSLSLPLVRLLVDRGADINSKDDNGWNALHLLCRYHHIAHDFQELVRILLDSGIDVNAKTFDGFNALHLLLLHQHGQYLIGVIRLMLERNININAKTSEGFTALHLLLRKCPMDDVMTVVNMFLEYRVQVLATDRDSWTALHFLCRFYTNDDLLDIIQLLVANNPVGRNQLLKLKNGDGQSPLELCLLNPSGHFHSVFEYVREDNHLFNRFFKFSPESLLDLANFGCVPMVSWFLDHHQHLKVSNVRDHQGRSWLDYLNHVFRSSLSLCRKCSKFDPYNCYTMTSLLVDCSSTGNNNSSPPLSYSSYTRQLKHRRISDRSLENFSIMYPAKSEIWNTLVQFWHKDDAESWADFGAIDMYALDHSHSRCNNNPADCKWCRVSEDVQNYLQSLIDQCEILDPRLAHTELIGYGSAFEKTNLFRPEEYDFSVVLKHFNELAIDDDDDWVDVVYGGPDSLNDNDFIRRDQKNLNRTISSERLLYHYGLVMEEVIRHADWNPKIFNPKVTIGESSCLTLIFYYRTEGYHGHPISVDLTLAVLSKIKKQPDWCPIPNLPHYIVPNRTHSPGLQKLKDWKLSSFVLERDTLLHHEFGETFVHILRILKILVCLNQAQPGERKFSRRMNIISTHDIKIELLEYARTHPPPWETNNIITHCRGVLDGLIQTKQLKQHCRRKSRLDYVYPCAHGFTCVKYIEEIIRRLKQWKFFTPQI